MQYKVVCAALGALLIAASAPAQQSQGNSVAPKARAAEKTYCLQFGFDTGSRINRTECKTKREWAKLGIDVDNLGEK